MRGNLLFKIIDKYAGIFAVFYLSIFRKTLKETGKQQDIKNILVVKLSALGDTILLFPVVKALKENYKTSKIVVVCTEINREIWETVPYVDKIYCLDIKGLFNPRYIFEFLFNLRKHNFDLAIDFDQWLRISAILTLVSHASKRIGFNTSGQYKHYGFTQTIKHLRNVHELDCFIELVRLLNINVHDKALSFPVSDEDKIKIKSILAEYDIDYDKEKYAVIHPGCGSHGWQREWPAEKYSDICNILIRKYGYHIVLIGGSSESKVVSLVIKNIKCHAINLQGQLNISTLAAFLNGAELFISGNTGIMHLAAAVGTTCIALHGPTNYLKWGPVGEGHMVINSPVSCSPCLNLGFEYGCKSRKCMEHISVTEVMRAVEGAVNE